MLFPLSPHTRRCQAFIVLNQFFLEFLQVCIDADAFTEYLFFDNSIAIRPVNTGSVCWDNQPTRNKFEGLWQEIAKLNQAERQNLFDEISSKQNIIEYFSDRALPLPEINGSNLFKKLSALTNHLFENTKKLAGIRDLCGGETIRGYYHQYCVDNGCVCTVCGTELLAQTRAGIDDEKQWLSDFDHLCSQSDYPMYTVHPDNLLPTCTTCNRKAKGSKALHLKKIPGGFERRLSFSPYSESCESFVGMKLLENEDLALEIKVCFNTEDPDTLEKLSAWDEVYLIKSRVEGCNMPFIPWIDKECRPINLDHFKEQITLQAIPHPATLRSECWSFWRQNFYQWIVQQSDEFKELLWSLIEQHRGDDDYGEIFGV